MKRLTSLLLFVLLFFLLSACKSKNEGPYFGNGFHNGWADQNSIVIWTRLTQNPELNRSGPEFLIPSAKEMGLHLIRLRLLILVSALPPVRITRGGMIQ